MQQLPWIKGNVDGKPALLTKGGDTVMTFENAEDQDYTEKCVNHYAVSIFFLQRLITALELKDAGNPLLEEARGLIRSMGMSK